MVRGQLEKDSSLKAEYLYEAVRLPRSSYYEGLKAEEKNFLKDKELWNRILNHWERFPGHGPKKIWKYFDGVNHKRIDRVIRKFLGHRLNPRTKKKEVKISGGKCFNVLKRIQKAVEMDSKKLQRGNWELTEGRNKYQKVLKATRPYQLWTGDWKEFKIPIVNLQVYIFIIIDTYTKILVGWHIGISKTEEESIKASEKAIEKYGKDPLFDGRKLIHHVDRGSAYTSDKYQRYWREHGVKLSYSEPGKPTQNGYSEGYMSLLQRFFFKYFTFESYGELREEFGKFIDLYNSEWKHSKISYMTPFEKLEEYRVH